MRISAVLPFIVLPFPRNWFFRESSACGQETCLQRRLCPLPWEQSDSQGSLHTEDNHGFLLACESPPLASRNSASLSPVRTSPHYELTACVRPARGLDPSAATPLRRLSEVHFGGPVGGTQDKKEGWPLLFVTRILVGRLAMTCEAERRLSIFPHAHRPTFTAFSS